MSDEQKGENKLADLPIEPQNEVSVSADEADSVRGGGKNELHSENVSLSFAKVAIEYKP